MVVVYEVCIFLKTGTRAVRILRNLFPLNTTELEATHVTIQELCLMQDSPIEVHLAISNFLYTQVVNRALGESDIEIATRNEHGDNLGVVDTSKHNVAINKSRIVNIRVGYIKIWKINEIEINIMQLNLR